eukprot:2484245-Prorocentrum_lima.AAC.1
MSSAACLLGVGVPNSCIARPRCLSTSISNAMSRLSRKAVMNSLLPIGSAAAPSSGSSSESSPK